MKTRRGEVILVLFPNSDLRTAKRRPALVLQRDNLASGLDHYGTSAAVSAAVVSMAGLRCGFAVLSMRALANLDSTD